MAFEAFDELRERVQAAARAPGRTTLGLPEIAVIRADIQRLRVEARVG